MRLVAVLGLALLVELAFPGVAAACACCSDPGYRSERKTAITAYEKATLGQVRFRKSVRIHADDSDESVRGIADPAGDYTLTSSLTGSVWTFTLRGSNGKSGTLSFTLPRALERFAVDPQDGNDTGNGPSLYKEWRLSARVSGSGIFKRGLAKGGTARLVLQGRGVACDEPDDFTHFSVQVSGAGAKYTFFGPLAKPAP